MKFRVIAIALLFISEIMSGGQNVSENFRISGTVADETTGMGLPGATVAIIQKTTGAVLTGGITDEKGFFSVDHISQSPVRLRFSMIGYRTFVIDSMELNGASSAGVIRLRSTLIEMPEIVISSVKPMIEFHSDKQVVNVDMLPGGTTASITEALKNSGAVEVDPSTNKITVHGQSVKLHIDGRQSDMPDEMLSQLPASMIDQVEVILAPGAKESAEGGTYIINLVSKKKTSDNYSGSVNLNTATNNSHLLGLNLNDKAGKLNLFGQVSGGYSPLLFSTEKEYYSYGSRSLYYQKMLEEGRNFQRSVYAKFGMDYDFDESNTMTLYGSYNMYNYNGGVESRSTVKNNAGDFQYSYIRDNTSGGAYGGLSLYGFYKKKFDAKGHELTFDLMATELRNPSDLQMNIDFSNQPGLPQKQNTHTGVDAKTLIFRTDYAVPINAGRLETGYNFTFRTRNNDYTVEDYSYLTNAWRDSMDLSNRFRYKENIHALYLTYSQAMDKFDMKAGVRVENLMTRGDQLTTQGSFSGNFLSLFPNLSISYRFSDLYQIGFNAFRRVSYPQISYVNPFRQYRGPNMYFAGNPKLGPYYVNSYSVNLSQYLNVFYVATTGSFTQETAAEDDTVLVSSYLNLNTTKTFGVDVTLPYDNTPSMPFQLPEFINTVRIKFGYLDHRLAGRFINEDLSAGERTYSVTANVGLTLWYALNATLSFYYRPDIENKRAFMGRQKKLSLFLSKTVMDGKLKLSLSIEDILNSNVNSAQTFGSSYYSKSSVVIQESRRIRFGITYMFNDYKERRDKNLDDGRDGPS